MSGISIVADTNVLINLAEGKKNVNLFLENNLVYISVITEIEVIGYYGISQRELRFFESLLRECTIVELIRPIKELAIKLRQTNKIKLPDAIIAATSLYMNAPLFTFDKEFSKISKLDLIIPE